jgi:hypothetical protein
LPGLPKILFVMAKLLVQLGLSVQRFHPLLQGGNAAAFHVDQTAHGALIAGYEPEHQGFGAGGEDQADRIGWVSELEAALDG